MTAWRSWGEVFRYYLDVKGYDHACAAYRADLWLARRCRRAQMRGAR
jgi:hypothetical protein